MSLIDTGYLPPFRLFTRLARAMRDSRRNARRRSSLASLRQLDDHLLRDIGLTRRDLVKMLGSSEDHPVR